MSDSRCGHTHGGRHIGTNDGKLPRKQRRDITPHKMRLRETVQQ
jgi:hypothetical protein